MTYGLAKGDFCIKGARRVKNGVCFTFVAPSVSSVCAICFYDINTKAQVERIVLSDEFRMGLVYSVEISGLDFEKLCYLYELDGAFVVDEYARTIVGREKYNDLTRREKEFKVYAGIEPVKKKFDDVKVSIKPCDMVLYKLHLRGFTKASQSKDAGEYTALIRKLGYLKELGITSLCFMPIYDFEEVMYAKCQLIDKNGKHFTDYMPQNKVNFWGYGKGFYFAPKASYFGEDPVNGLKKMVAAIHSAGMEVILEFTMDGMPSRFVKECLYHYVFNYHIDGFRLIGASVPASELMRDEFLADVKLIFENVPEGIENFGGAGKHIFVLNDGFMNVIRQMEHGMNGNMVELTNHLKRQNQTYGFINTASSVSGFTLWDSVCYSTKHNEANGEENRDGTNQNYSVNYGVEGPTRNKAVQAARLQSVRNSLTLTILAQAIPGLMAGDESLNSAMGNNNPYPQDNEVGWITPSKGKDAKALYAFVQGLLTFRRQHACLRAESPLTVSDSKHIGVPDLSYHAQEPWTMCVYEGQKTIGMLYPGAYADETEDVFIACNYSYKAEKVALPRIPGPGKRWRVIVDTSSINPINLEGEEISDEHFVNLSPSAVVVLVAVPQAVSAKAKKKRTQENSHDNG